MQIAQAGANRLLSPGSSRRESDLLATKAFGASLRGRRGHVALAGLSGRAATRPSSKSIHGQIKIEETNILQSTCKRDARQVDSGELM